MSAPAWPDDVSLNDPMAPCPIPVDVTLTPSDSLDIQELTGTVIIHFPHAPLRLPNFLIQLTPDGCHWYAPGRIPTVRTRPMPSVFGERWTFWLDQAFHEAVAKYRHEWHRPSSSAAPAPPQPPVPTAPPQTVDPATWPLRDQQVYVLTKQGLTIDAIATRLFLHPRQVKQVRLRIRQKLSHSTQPPTEPLDTP